MEKEKGKIVEEIQEDPLRVRLFLVRHGMQTAYHDSDSELSPDGKKQVDHLAMKLCSQFQEEGNKKRIRILHSSRIRTEQSAVRMSKILIQATIDGDLRGSEVIPPLKWDDLQTADAIGPLLDNGVPKENVCSAWLNLPKETLRHYKAEPSDDLLQRLLLTVKELEENSRDIETKKPNEPEINIIGLTHEPTLWAVLQLNPHIDITESDVKHTEYIQIDIAHGHKPTVFKFRGHQFYPNGLEE